MTASLNLSAESIHCGSATITSGKGTGASSDAGSGSVGASSRPPLFPVPVRNLLLPPWLQVSCSTGADSTSTLDASAVLFQKRALTCCRCLRLRLIGFGCFRRWRGFRRCLRLLRAGVRGLNLQIRDTRFTESNLARSAFKETRLPDSCTRTDLKRFAFLMRIFALVPRAVPAGFIALFSLQICPIASAEATELLPSAISITQSNWKDVFEVQNHSLRDPTQIPNPQQPSTIFAKS